VLEDQQPQDDLGRGPGPPAARTLRPPLPEDRPDRVEHRLVAQQGVDPALERKPVEVEDLAAYVARKDAEKAGSSSEEGEQEKPPKLDKAVP
jgi:hypothetical protein